MEVAIFGFASLIYLTVFLAACALPFYLASIFGNFIDQRVKNCGFRRLFPIVLLAVTAGWGWATYVVFERDCGLVPNPMFAITKPQRPDGFTFYNSSNFHPAAGFRWEAAMGRGYFKFIDFAYPKLPWKMDSARKLDYSNQDNFSYQRSCAERVVDGYTHRSCDPFKAIPKAETIVAILPERKSEYWWHPPIYKLEMQVKERSTGNVIASATDLVIGGGVVGSILRAFGGDQDYEFLSCGYASPDIGPWRPSLSSRPRFVQYEDADTNFVVYSFAEP